MTELEKQAKQLIEDANKHAKEATAEATQSETVAAQATATTDLKSAAEEAQEAGKHSVKAVTLSDQAVDEANVSDGRNINAVPNEHLRPFTESSKTSDNSEISDFCS